MNGEENITAPEWFQDLVAREFIKRNKKDPFLTPDEFFLQLEREAQEQEDAQPVFAIKFPAEHPLAGKDAPDHG